MKASLLKGYNQPLELTENAEIPTLSPSQPDHVLIKVIAAGVNPVDYKLAQGDLSTFVSLTFPCVLGFDFSGVITQKGSNVSQFNVGDAVYGKISPDEAKRGGGAYQAYAVEYT